PTSSGRSSMPPCSTSWCPSPDHPRRACPIRGHEENRGMLFRPLALVWLGWLLAGDAPARGAHPTPDALHWQPLPSLPGDIGLAGPFAGVSEDALIVAGGARFSQVPLVPRGAKQCYDTIYVLADPDGAWQVGGQLPRALAHGLSV